VSVAVLPEQSVLVDCNTLTTIVFTCTAVVAVPTQPLVFIPITVKIVLEVGFAITMPPEAPVLQL
jgi:hypothetical protein